MACDRDWKPANMRHGPGDILSPSDKDGPGQYPPHSNCQWLIYNSAPGLRVRCFLFGFARSSPTSTFNNI